METIASFEELIQTMQSELGEQVIAVKELAVAITESERQIGRRDQVTRLHILKSRVRREVEDIERMESAALSSANKSALLGGGIAFSLGSLFMAAVGRKDAFSDGARMAESVLARKIPFDTVLIAVGKGGLPEGLEAISLSRLARESSKSESEVEDSLKSNGYLLMTPEQFAELLDKMECGILDGSYSLPLTVDALSLLIT